MGLVPGGQDDNVDAVRVSLAAFAGGVGHLRREVHERQVFANDHVLGQRVSNAFWFLRGCL
jgi:hypothetical protein